MTKAWSYEGYWNGVIGSDLLEDLVSSGDDVEAALAEAEAEAIEAGAEASPEWVDYRKRAAEYIERKRVEG